MLKLPTNKYYLVILMIGLTIAIGLAVYFISMHGVEPEIIAPLPHPTETVDTIA